MLLLWVYLSLFAASSSFQVEDLAPRAELRFRQNNFATPAKYPFETMGGGVAALDFNNDGLLDLLFLNGAPSPEHRKTNADSFNRLFRNDGNLAFTDVTAASGLDGHDVVGYPQGVAIADFDNDGFVDVFVSNYGNNVLYRNQGNGTFKNVTETAGVAMPQHPFKASACWLDFDNDGWLDLFVTHYFHWTFKEHADYHCGIRKPSWRSYCRPDEFKPLPNALFRNNHDGTFTDVSETAGIAGHAGKGMGVVTADYDNDGWMDLFITNDRAANFLFKNRGGRFEEVALVAGVYANEAGTFVSGMGCDMNDYDNDGFPDIFYTDLVTECFGLFRNLGNGLFQDTAYPSRIAVFSATRSGWSNKFMDWDNDGWKDVLALGSHVLDNSELYNPRARYREPCFFFHNTGNGKFEDWSSSLGPDFQKAGANRGLAVGDFDNDGRLEAVVNRLNDVPLFFRVKSQLLNHWLLLRLEGRKSNRDGIGAKIKAVLPSGRSVYEHVTTANGIYSASDKRVHLGLGKEAQVSTLEIRWPSGVVQKLANVRAGQVLTVVEGE
ncbi:MAG: CRTAC1 family protein [Acidobacteria bacterium]|nr:MAG: CRTAC1 family protein [Acidobacteriota bacterium]